MITRAILKDKNVEVVSAGTQFYNANDFPHIAFAFAFCEVIGRVKPQKLKMRHLRMIWRQALKDLQGHNKIVIAATPSEVDSDYLSILDGGILHEAFHTLYTHRGRDLDLDRMLSILDRTYDPEVLYEKKPKLLKDFLNVYEDSHIERKGIQEFGGALYSLNKVHQRVWDREKEMRRGGSLISHVMCYMRDRVQPYLSGAPLDEYNDTARHLVDVLMADIVQRGQNTADTYECFELAMETLNALHYLPTEQKREREKRKSRESPTESSDEDHFSEVLDQPREEEPEETEEEDGELPDEGETEGETEEEDGELPDEDLPDDEDLEELRDADESDISDIESVVNNEWDKVDSQVGPSQRVERPFTREHDRVIHIKHGDTAKFREISKEVRKDSLYLRSKLMVYLKGEKKVKRRYNQRRGKRLGRGVHEVVFKKKPRAFQTRTTKEVQHAAVSIVIDESFSMRKEKDRSQYMLATFAVSLQQLQIPFEVVGFRSGYCLRDTKEAKEVSDWSRFTRSISVYFDVFRTFDEPFTDTSLSKLMMARAEGGTPLLAGYDFAARRLLERTEPRKIIIVITDGYPMLLSNIQVCNSESEILEGLGVETIFVGYGEGASKITQFRNHIHIKDLQEFSREMNKYLLGSLRGKSLTTA